MKKVDPSVIENYTNEIKQEGQSKNNVYPEISIIKEKGAEDPNVYINMEFLGLDLSSVPTQNLSDPKVYVIPVLYVISSFVSMKLTNNLTAKKKKKQEEGDGKQEGTELDAVAQANKSMMYLMPVMSVSISLVAPLGLALYWLVSNLLMIVERLILNKLDDKEEERENA